MTAFQALSLVAYFLYPSTKRMMVHQAKSLSTKAKSLNQQLSNEGASPNKIDMDKPTATILSKHETSFIGASLTLLVILGCVTCITPWISYLSSSVLHFRTIQLLFGIDIIAALILGANHRSYELYEALCQDFHILWINSIKCDYRIFVILIRDEYLLTLISTISVITIMAISHLLLYASLIQAYLNAVAIITMCFAYINYTFTGLRLSTWQRLAQGLSKAPDMLLPPILLSGALGVNLSSMIIVYQMIGLVVSSLGVYNLEDEFMTIQRTSHIMRLNYQLCNAGHQAVFQTIGVAVLKVYDLCVSTILSISDSLQKYGIHSISHNCQALIQAQTFQNPNTAPNRIKKATEALQQAIVRSTALLEPFTDQATFKWGSCNCDHEQRDRAMKQSMGRGYRGAGYL